MCVLANVWNRFARFINLWSGAPCSELDVGFVIFIHWISGRLPLLAWTHADDPAPGRERGSSNDDG